jgi:cation:H+ antiporter
MITALGAVVIGIAILAWAADQFVLGAARVALIRKVPSIVVGVVILGFGTSAPEMLVSAIAVAGGDTDVAIGNIVGSNIANLTLLLGIGAIVVPLAVSSRTVKIEAPLVVLAVGAFAYTVQGGGISRIEAVGLAAAMVVSLVLVTRPSADAGTGAAPTDQLGEDVIELADVATHSIGREIGRTIIGLAGTIGSAQLLLWGAGRAQRRVRRGNPRCGRHVIARTGHGDPIGSSPRDRPHRGQPARLEPVQRLGSRHRRRLHRRA